MNKKSILTLLLLLLISLLIRFPDICLKAASDGLLLWFNKVLPSLLPFIIFINLLVPLDGLRFLTVSANALARRLWHLPGYSFFAFLMGLIGSYPMGAKTVKSLYQEGKLSQADAQLTLCFCNNCGPLFIIATVGGAMFGCISLGYFLLTIHILSVILLSLFVSRHHTCTSYAPKLQQVQAAAPSFTVILNRGVANAMETILCIGGYIILFSVLLALMTQAPLLTAFINRLLPDETAFLWYKGSLASLMELSNGCHTLSQLQPISIYSVALVSAAISFGGLCVYCQTLYVIDNVLSTTAYLPVKAFQGLISFALTLLFYPLYFLYTEKTILTIQPKFIVTSLLLLLISYLLLPYATAKCMLPKQQAAVRSNCAS